MCVRDPRKYKRNGGKDNSCEEDTEVANCDGILGCEKDIPDCSDKTSACDERASDAKSIRKECTCDNTDEAEDVRRSRETV